MARFITFAVTGEGTYKVATDTIVGIAQLTNTTTAIFQKGGYETVLTHDDDSTDDLVYTELLAAVEDAQDALQSPSPSIRDVKEKNITFTLANGITGILTA